MPIFQHISYRESQQKIVLIEQTLQENSEAIELSKYIKTHYPKIYDKWEEENLSTH